MTLELKHPVTKELIDFSLLSFEELAELESLSLSLKTEAELKLDWMITMGRDVPQTTSDFVKYCGLIAVTCQRYKAITRNTSALREVAVLKKAISEFLEGQILIQFEQRVEDLLNGHS